MKTGAIQAGIDRLVVQRLHGRERWMIPILMTVFALGGTTYGMAEESLAFYVAGHHRDDRRRVRRADRRGRRPARLRDRHLGSTINPFATGIASGFAGVSISDGLVLRLVILVVGLAVGIFFVLRYAERVRRDPTQSLVSDMREANEAALQRGTRRRAATSS